MATDMSKDYRLATDDEEYPQGFSDGPEDEEENQWPEEDEEENQWPEEDYYDWPEDNKDGLFDPMEEERP